MEPAVRSRFAALALVAMLLLALLPTLGRLGVGAGMACADDPSMSMSSRNAR